MFDWNSSFLTRVAMAGVAMAGVVFSAVAEDYNWFKCDTNAAFYADNPFNYGISKPTPENALCQLDVQINLGSVEWASLEKEDTTGMQAGIVRLADSEDIAEFAVLTGDGWTCVFNDDLDENISDVLVSARFDYSWDPGYVSYYIIDANGEHLLADVDDNSEFVCAGNGSAITNVFAHGEGVITSVAGAYKVDKTDLVEVAPGTTNVLEKSLADYNEERFQVSGGGTLLIRGQQVPYGGSDMYLHIDKGSSVVFDLRDLSPLNSIVYLFNHIDTGVVIGENVSVRVPGQGTERLAALFGVEGGEDDYLEARIAEQPSFEGSGSFGPVAKSGGKCSASITLDNAVEGFWYAIEYADALQSDFLLDNGKDAVKQCNGEALFLESSPNTLNPAFYRVKVSVDAPR